ncbi:MAG TPA: hypothetical protein VH040_18920 [Usitatibacter sp.]|nr:hypothetical protein [Usitatibacter sp.]
MRILLVDDNPTDVAQSLDALRGSGIACSVVVARGRLSRAGRCAGLSR